MMQFGTDALFIRGQAGRARFLVPEKNGGRQMLKKRKLSLRRAFVVLLCIVTAIAFMPAMMPQEAHAASVTIDETNFPDENFRTYVSSHFDTDGDNSLSDDEIANAKSISLGGTTSARHNVRSLKGIEYLTALTYLDADYGSIESLDVSSNPDLETLSFRSNEVSSIDISNNTKLTYLNCSINNLTSLNVSSNTKLETLVCGGNELSSGLDVSMLPELKQFRCYANKLTSIDLTHNTKLGNCGYTTTVIWEVLT